VEFILFDLDLKLYLKGFENKYKNLPPGQLAAWKPTGPASFSSSPAFGPSGQSR
jgi:hypothetical protein